MSLSPSVGTALRGDLSGLIRIADNLRRLGRVEVDAGSIGPDGGETEWFQPRPNLDGTVPLSPGPVATVLGFHEFGRMRNAPRRSVIAHVLADPSFLEQLGRLKSQAAAAVIGGADPGRAARPLGQYAQGEFRRRVRSADKPPLKSWARAAAAAGRRDPRLIPLWDTKQIERSIRFHVREGVDGGES